VLLDVVFWKIVSEAAITPMNPRRKVKAVAANTWRLVQIGHKEDWLLHTDLSALEVYLAELLDTARTMKAKTFTISIGSGDGRGLV